MDNKITKKRLSDFLSYDWILMIIIAVVGIIVWELIFSVAGVRLSTGQQFKYYIDETLYSGNNGTLFELLSDSFSYDVKSFETETLTSQYNVLSTRLSIYDGDVIFTDCRKGEDENSEVRANVIIDNPSYRVSDFGTLLKQAKEYLSQFLKSEFSGLSDSEKAEKSTDFSNLDKAKIEENFVKRTDKRVYKNDIRAGLISVENEYQRIEKLCGDVVDFQKILEYSDDSVFYRYTKYEQVSAGGGEYSEVYQREIDEGRANAVYGINLGKLKGGTHDASEFFKMSGTDEATDVVVLVFDFIKEQPDLQFESISFINKVVRLCSDILG